MFGQIQNFFSLARVRIGRKTVKNNVKGAATNKKIQIAIGISLIISL